MLSYLSSFLTGDSRSSTQVEPYEGLDKDSIHEVMEYFVFNIDSTTLQDLSHEDWEFLVQYATCVKISFPLEVGCTLNLLGFGSNQKPLSFLDIEGNILVCSSDLKYIDNSSKVQMSLVEELFSPGKKRHSSSHESISRTVSEPILPLHSHPEATLSSSMHSHDDYSRYLDDNTNILSNLNTNSSSRATMNPVSSSENLSDSSRISINTCNLQDKEGKRSEKITNRDKTHLGNFLNIPTFNFQAANIRNAINVPPSPLLKLPPLPQSVLSRKLVEIGDLLSYLGRLMTCSSCRIPRRKCQTVRFSNVWEFPIMSDKELDSMDEDAYFERAASLGKMNNFDHTLSTMPPSRKELHGGTHMPPDTTPNSNLESLSDIHPEENLIGMQSQTSQITSQEPHDIKPEDENIHSFFHGDQSHRVWRGHPSHRYSLVDGYMGPNDAGVSFITSHSQANPISPTLVNDRENFEVYDVHRVPKSIRRENRMVTSSNQRCEALSSEGSNATRKKRKSKMKRRNSSFVEDRHNRSLSFDNIQLVGHDFDSLHTDAYGIKEYLAFENGCRERGALFI